MSQYVLERTSGLGDSANAPTSTVVAIAAAIENHRRMGQTDAQITQWLLTDPVEVPVVVRSSGIAEAFAYLATKGSTAPAPSSGMTRNTKIGIAVLAVGLGIAIIAKKGK